ncbi:unnamed protein product [Adineta steineri]|uniref:L-Fucosyltransferase n=1 Tax=Adineta steineri TaxID=433720 RepID=A0A814HYK5_9BILA|nr:unnamed protein product [Adineta steineri]CAF3819249.1 unnamed protein product [Adineta steineri]
MFASAYGLSRSHGCSLYIGDRFKKTLNEVFELNLTNEISKEKVQLLQEEHIVSRFSECDFDVKLMRPEAIQYFELHGYWQAHGYFSRYMDEIRALLSFKQSIVTMALILVSSLLTKPLSANNSTSFEAVKEHIKATSSVTWVGIHIRRGDFRRYVETRVGRTVSSIEYFDKAIAYFTKRYDNQVLFIVASDDKSYCRKVFRNRQQVIVTPDTFTREVDLAVLSLCTDIIASSGTFSWWAAALAGGVVVHDEQYPRYKTKKASSQAKWRQKKKEEQQSTTSTPRTSTSNSNDLRKKEGQRRRRANLLKLTNENNQLRETVRTLTKEIKKLRASRSLTPPHDSPTKVVFDNISPSAKQRAASRIKDKKESLSRGSSYEIRRKPRTFDPTCGPYGNISDPTPDYSGIRRTPLKTVRNRPSLCRILTYRIPDRITPEKIWSDLIATDNRIRPCPDITIF